ncbi:MAG: O-antigen polymerase, partial [Fusobacterium mortiferum]|nr:O-antigen polymerase [Fusobacterium mortiferum]
KEKKYLLIYLTGLLFPILCYSRGFILLIIVSSIVILLFQNRKYLKKAVLVGIIVLYLFGMAGNVRHHYDVLDTTMIKKIAIIDTEESILDPFYWSYVYISSPLGNLQTNIKSQYHQYSLKKFLTTNLLPEFISEKIITTTAPTKRMVSNLTVSTMYIKAYNNFGIIGMYIIFILYTLFNMIYIRLLENTKNYQVGITLLYLIQVFSIFSNMYTLSSVGISLFYVFIYKIKNIISYKK